MKKPTAPTTKRPSMLSLNCIHISWRDGRWDSEKIRLVFSQNSDTRLDIFFTYGQLEVLGSLIFPPLISLFAFAVHSRTSLWRLG